MGHIRLDSKVYKTFERITADKQIDAKDIAALDHAIKADGKVDTEEKELIDLMDDRLRNGHSLTVSTEHKKMSFDPSAMHFDDQSKVALGKLRSEQNHEEYSQHLPDILTQAERSKDPDAVYKVLQNVASTLDTYRQAGVPGVNANLRKLAETMNRIEKRDQLMNPLQQVKWLELKLTIAPQQALEQLRQFARSPNINDKEALSKALSLIVAKESPKKLAAFLTSLAAAKPELKQAIQGQLTELSRNKDKAVAQAAGKALKSIDSSAASDAAAKAGAVNVQNLFAQKPVPISDIAKALENPASRDQTLNGLFAHLDKLGEAERIQTLLDLEQAAKSKYGETAKILDGLSKAYPSSNTSADEKVWGALWKASKSSNRQDQARILETIGRQFPKDKRIKVGIENLLAKPNQSPADKVAYERALLTVDPEKGAKALINHLKPPASNLSPAEQKAAIHSILKSTRGNPALQAQFGPLLKDIIQKGPAEVLFSLADGMQDQQWPDREAFTLLLKNSRNQEPVRLQAINGLAQLALKGDKDAVNAMADHYAKTASISEQKQIEGMLHTLVASKGPVADIAAQRLKSLPVQNQAKPEDAQAPKARAGIDAAIKDFQAKFSEYANAPYDPYAAIYHVATRSKPDIPGWFSAENKDKLLKHGTPKQKADFTNLLRAHDSDKARALMLEILTSTKTRAELDDVEDGMRGKGAARPELGFSKAQQDEYAKHQKHLREFDYRLKDTTRAVMKMAPDEKGRFLGKALADYTDGKLSPDEAREAVGYILESIASKEDYDAALGAMRAKFPKLGESTMLALLGSDKFAKLKANIGVAPAKLGFESEKEFVEIANRFFDSLSQLEGDDYLSTNNLVKNNPRIKEQLFFRNFLDPNYYRNASPAERQDLLNNRMKLAKLIAAERIKVGTVPQYFADKYLFGKQQLGLFELSGDFHLKDFVSGSIRDKAKQYVAIDEFAGKIYDVTKHKFSEMQNRLLSQANDPELGSKLKRKGALIAPYARALNEPTPADPRKPIVKLLAQLEAENASASPKLSKADLQLKAEIIIANHKLIQEYGIDGPKAAAKMKEQAAKLAETAKELGITSGSYAQDRLEFRKKAYALYHDSSMDMLNAAYKEALSQMSPDAQAVVKNADDLEDQIDTAKKGVVIAGKIVGGMVGLGILIDVTEFGIKMAQHYDKASKVDKVRRSPEAQAREMDAILLDAAITVGVNVVKGAKEARADKAAEKAAENISRTTVSNGAEYAEKKAQELLDKKLRDVGKEALIDHGVLDPSKEDVVEKSTGHGD